MVIESNLERESETTTKRLAERARDSILFPLWSFNATSKSWPCTTAIHGTPCFFAIDLAVFATGQMV